jgi:hypothetical protein
MFKGSLRRSEHMRVFTGLKMGSKMGPEHRVKGQEVSPKGVRAFLEKPKATFFKKML